MHAQGVTANGAMSTDPRHPAQPGNVGVNHLGADTPTCGCVRRVREPDVRRQLGDGR